MTYERTRAIVVATLRMCRQNIADANSRAEVETDAGTKNPYAFDEGPDPDEVMEKEREREDRCER